MPSQSFSEAISGLPSAKQFSDFLPFLDRLPSKGYTGIWVENDIITPGPESHHPDIEQDYQILFRGNFKLHNIFDYTFRPDNEVYVTHLAQLMAACAERGLAVYLSFWIPKLSKAFYEFLLTEHPSAIGSSTTFHYKRTPTLSTCEGSGGLELLEAIVANLMERFPGIAGLKVACEDNAAWICDEESPFANGTTRARHTANMYRAVLSGIRRHSPDAKLLIYPWIWAEGAGEEVYKLLKDDYFIMSKLESGSHQDLGPGMPTHPIMDASIVSERPGDIFSFWKERVGTSRIFDMVPVGAGIDDFFLNYPPYPGRVFRRLKLLKEQGVRGFLDFECGGHHEGSCEEAVALFQQTGEADQEQFLNRLAAGMTGNEAAARLAVAGWNAFDKGFGFIPMGLGDTGEFTNLFSERLGFAWSMCIATPLLPEPFLAEDKLHHVHFFSPYALFHGRTVQRLELFFQQVWRHWAEATAALKAAAALDPENQALRREAIAARAHFLSMSSVLHWCLAARLSESGDHAAFGRLQIEEVELTKSFQALITANPWVWDNNCWQPHRTPMSQRNLHPLMGANANLEADTFQTKLAIMRARLDSKVFRGGAKAMKDSNQGLEFPGFQWPSSIPEDCPFEASKELTGIYFTGRCSDYHCGDTFYPSWASDGNLYSPWTDGVTDGVDSHSNLRDQSVTGQAILRGDDPLNLEIRNTAPPKVASALPYEGRYPAGTLVHDGIWYYGTYCLAKSGDQLHNGFIWNWPNLGPMPGFHISRDFGKTWEPSPHTADKPLFPEPAKYLGPVKMGAPHFVDFGQNMEHSPDGKAYLVAMGAEENDPLPRPCVQPGVPGEAFKIVHDCPGAFAHGNLSWISADQVYLARVTPSPETINDLAAYEFFAGHDSTGEAVWTSDFSKIKPLLEWNNHMGCVTVSYVPGLKKYLMCVTDGWPTVSKMTSYILEADSLTGPWRMVTYMKDFGEQAYFLNFPTKFMSPDGRKLWLCYSANFSDGWNGEALKINPPGGRYGLCLHEVELLAP